MAAKRKAVQDNQEDGTEIVNMSLRLPRDLHERLRKMNYETRETQHAFVLRSIDASLKAAKY